MSPDTYLKHLEAFGLLAEGSSFFCMAVDNKAFAVADRWRWVSWRVGRRWVAAGRRGGRGGFPQMPSPVFSLPKPRRLWQGSGLPWLAGDPPSGGGSVEVGASGWRWCRPALFPLRSVLGCFFLPVGAAGFWSWCKMWSRMLGGAPAVVLLLDLLCHESAWWSKPRGAPARCSPAWWLWSPCSTTALGVQVLGCLVAADCGLSSAEVLLEASRCSSSLGMLGAKVLRSQKRPRPAGAGLLGAGCGGSGVGCPLPSC